MNDFERIGGEVPLRAVISDFVGRCFDDVMIGFLFRRANRERIERFEYEHAAVHLGAGTTYGGKPLEQAHGRHRIMGGQFDRRRRLLEQTLQDHHVPEDVRARWLAAQDALRSSITSDVDSSSCVGAPTGPKR